MPIVGEVYVGGGLVCKQQANRTDEAALRPDPVIDGLIHDGLYTWLDMDYIKSFNIYVTYRNSEMKLAVQDAILTLLCGVGGWCTAVVTSQQSIGKNG